MKKTTPFYRLAERIGNCIHGPWFCCSDLPKKEVLYFEELFKPSTIELEQYNHIQTVWMAEQFVPQEEDNNFRILALLLCHEIYLSENK